ncbi:hypothetical protein FNV43_RR16594 [Rhamnella rubrinervis]|uniref:Dirigent protein n=1 Tax=Rhamnella rubrinervis TaxID=2594499 RepID=A0A8K0GZ22_9ROSA|nr:hypothetical protein FNV43_RR16594 [Rhamnella rubrinervis]
MDELLTVGKYNGSTLSILGRNAVLSKLSEMPIVGGTGVFRFASGYVQARAPSAYLKTKYAVEFNVYAFHY